MAIFFYLRSFLLYISIFVSHYYITMTSICSHLSTFRFIHTILVWILCLIGLLCMHNDVFANPPSFDKDFVSPLTRPNASYGNESLFSFTDDQWKKLIDRDKSITENIKVLFYPRIDGTWWRIRKYFRWFVVIILVGMLIVQWFYRMKDGDDDKKAISYSKNLLWIFIWAVIILWATYILWAGLRLWDDWWTVSLYTRLDTWLVFQLLTALRVWAYFMAIIWMMRYGWKLLFKVDEDGRSEVKQWLLNILYALALIKIIDYVFFIAQSPQFTSKATELIVELSKTLWYILWSLFTLSLLYYWFRLLFSGWNDESLTKVKDVIQNILVISLVLFFFFLIVYQIVMEFA